MSAITLSVTCDTIAAVPEPKTWAEGAECTRKAVWIDVVADKVFLVMCTDMRGVSNDVDLY